MGIKAPTPARVPMIVVGLKKLGTPKERKHKHFMGISHLLGLHYKGVCMGYPYPYFCLCAFWGP